MEGEPQVIHRYDSLSLVNQVVFTLLLQLEVVRGSRKRGDCLGSVAGGAVAGQCHWK